MKFYSFNQSVILSGLLLSTVSFTATDAQLRGIPSENGNSVESVYQPPQHYPRALSPAKEPRASSGAHAIPKHSKITHHTNGKAIIPHIENHTQVIDVSTYDKDRMLAPIPESRIVGGTNAGLGEFKFMVSWNQECGGSLIGPDLVLTAAHCLEIQGPVRVGSDFLTSGGVTRQVAQKCGHPNYSASTSDYDYAILKLSQPVDMNLYRTIQLNNDASQPQVNELLTVIGFGGISENGPLSTRLQKVQVPANAHSTCSQQYPGVQEKIHLCAGYTQGGKDSCQGDSGGPIFATRNGLPVQVGVVSFGDGCARPNASGVYARVSGAYTWIQNTMASLSAGNGCSGGGGGSPTRPPTPPPVLSPTRPPTTQPVPSPTRPPTPPPVPSPTRPPSPQPVPSPTRPPTPPPILPTGNSCQDDPVGWHDADGIEFTCTWYSAGRRCQRFGDLYPNQGKTAKQACCVCGGGNNGNRGTCRDVPGWHDSDGLEFDCAYYAIRNRCTLYGSDFANFGYTAQQACCVCGGGM